MDKSQKASYDVGVAKGQAQEKGSQLMEKAGNAAEAAKKTGQGVGEQVKVTAVGTADAVKNATGMNK